MSKVFRLKTELYQRGDISSKEKDIANQYLSKVLDALDEYRF